MPVVRLKSHFAGLTPSLHLGDDLRTGGEGAVYFTRDGQFAVKVYHQPRPDREQVLQQVMTLFYSLPAEQERFILPPLALVESLDGKRRVGFVMRSVPPAYRELLDFTLNPKVAAEQFQQGKSWAQFLKVARSIANAVGVLHGKGCAHSDIHYRNFMVNLAEGHAVMLEIDGVAVPGWLSAGVKGMMGFIAPEVLTQRVSPHERTDRHSLAVLILHTLLFRNVLQPLVEYANDPERSEELGWGEKALFSEHPQERAHRPRNLGLPLFRQGALTYRMLTPTLQRLTERALLGGLCAPDQRPSSREWEEALACAMDELWSCSRCQQHFPYPYWLTPVARRVCPFCGERIQPPYPAVLELHEERQRHSYFSIGRRLVLGNNFKIFSDTTDAGCKPPLTRKNQAVVGHVEWDRQQQQYRLVNDEGGQWTARSADGSQRSIARKGESVPLVNGHFIHFGDGHRLAVVIEASATLNLTP